MPRANRHRRYETRSRRRRARRALNEFMLDDDDDLLDEEGVESPSWAYSTSSEAEEVPSEVRYQLQLAEISKSR